MTTRRNFLKQSLVAGSATMLPYSSLANLWQDRPQFKMSLNPGAIGVSMPLEPLMSMAYQYGFRALAADPNKIRELSAEKREMYLTKFRLRGMSWDSANLPVNFRETEKDYQSGQQRLIEDAKTLQEIGATRMNTWIMPTHKSYTYRENFKLHAERIGEMAEKIAPYGIKLGLEYVGPKTLMARDKYSFIRTMAELKELIAATGQSNVGIQLDAFHWFCAGETVEDIKSLKAEQIVTVDLNDAKAGRTADEQLDWERELPGRSGLIDLRGFLTALRDIGYDGPIRAEPFNKELGEKGNQQALADTSRALKSSFILATD